ncbi:MAG: hypothetical protein ACXV4C_08280 [Halobacteriota archaeon]
MTAKLSKEAEQHVAGLIEEALGTHAVEHAAEEQTLEQALNKVTAEVDKLANAYNTLSADVDALGDHVTMLATEVKNAHDRLRSSTVELVTPLADTILKLNLQFSTLSERVMRHLEAEASK